MTAPLDSAALAELRGKYEALIPHGWLAGDVKMGQALDIIAPLLSAAESLAAPRAAPASPDVEAIRGRVARYRAEGGFNDGDEGGAESDIATLLAALDAANDRLRLNAVVPMPEVPNCVNCETLRGLYLRHQDERDAARRELAEARADLEASQRNHAADLTEAIQRAQQRSTVLAEAQAEIERLKRELAEAREALHQAALFRELHGHDGGGSDYECG